MRSLRINGLGLLGDVGGRGRERESKEVARIRELRSRRWREKR
jgi:hypothetical protein